MMPVPLDAIRAIHNAFRYDMTAMDEAADSAAHNSGNLGLVLKRYDFFNEVLVWHAVGEEKFVFPAMEKIAPLVSPPYEQDHRGLDSLFSRLSKAIDSKDLIEIARATAAFKFHLDIHLLKEDSHLYRIYNENVPLPEQAATIGNMAREVPQQRYGEFVTWLITFTGLDDRENMTRIWLQAMPPPAFAAIAGLIQAVAGDDWVKLTQRIPELKSTVKSQSR
jgi:iron-sulfur cluster repair protein YtfE (RIC family)